MSRTVNNLNQHKAVPMMYAVIYVLATSIIMSAFNIYYTNHVQHQSNENICRIIVTLDDAYSQIPPRTAFGQHLAIDIHKARIGYGC